MRKVLLASLAIVVLVCAVGAVAGGWLWNRAAIDTVGDVDFDRPLAIPPLAEARVDDEGRRVFELVAAEGSHDFGQGRATPTYGFSGDYLGPTLRARRGEQVVVNVDNRLDEPTTVHWHGMRLPAIMDGGPHQSIPPRESWSPTWQVDQPAATLWYHPHPHGQTEQHVYRGMAGLFIIDDELTAELDLPSEYGVDDIPVIVQDKRFTRDGRLSERAHPLSDSGLLGDTVVVNGTVGPYLEVVSERVRLRLLNGSTARTYEFGFGDDRSFALIGTDGGLLSAPHVTDRVRLSPGERAEIVVEMRPGEEVVLRSHPPTLGVGHPGGRFEGRDDTLEILQLRAADQLLARPPLPQELVDVPRLDRSEAVTTREFELSGHEINGRRMEMGRIDFAVEAGSVEIWHVRNTDGDPHNFHVHDIQFQLLSVDGAMPPPELAGWKDTIYLPPGVDFEIIARFSRYADPDTPYMFHCHLLLHEDAGMMGQFVVVEPGQQPGGPAAGHDH